MKRFIIFLGLLLSVSSAFAAGRFVPDDLIFVQIRDVNTRTMEIKLVNASDGFIKRIYKSAYIFRIAQGVRIKDERNKWVVRGKLPNYKGYVFGVRFSNAGQLNEMMILSDEEIMKNIDKIKQQNWKGEIR